MRVSVAVRRGFTLVELLIVLAIISILAGILFPVFLSARQSAQKVRCLANFKNAYDATALYAQDYDDRLIPINHRPGMAPDPLTDQTWPQILLPYARDFRVFDCPSDMNPMDFGGAFDPDLLPGDYATRYYNAALHSDIGYNAYYLAPVVRSGTEWISVPKAMSEVNRPSDTLVFVESKGKEGGSYLVAPPCRYVVDHNRWFDTFQPGSPQRLPDSYDPIYAPVVGWDDSGRPGALPLGGVGVRHGNRLNVARIDGSARSVTLESLKRGCQVKPGWTGAIVDPARYVWSPGL